MAEHTPKRVAAPKSKPTSSDNAPEGTAVGPLGMEERDAVPEGTAVGPRGREDGAGHGKSPKRVQGGKSPHPLQAGGKSSEPCRDMVGRTVKLGTKVYEVLSCENAGSEAELFVVSDGQVRYALKLFRSGYPSNDKVIPLVRTLCGRGLIADIYDTGVLEGRKFELMEYCPHGAASAIDLRGNENAILAITIKTAIAIDACHKAGFVHKDIKPANILIEDPASYDSVICDFGIADILKDGRVTTVQTRTPTYAAPELYDTQKAIGNVDGRFLFEITGKADYYSLGMTILCLWYGEGAFRAKETEMAATKLTTGIGIPSDMPDKLATIARGLLIRNPAKRWDLEEIERYLNGEEVSTDEGEIIEDLNIVFDAGRHKMANSPEELALCMMEDTDLGEKYLYKGKIHDWLAGRPELQDPLEDIVEKRFPHDRFFGLLAALFVLDPALSFPLCGSPRSGGEEEQVGAQEPQDIADWCSSHFCCDDTKRLIASDVLLDWLAIHDQALSDRVARIASYKAGDKEDFEIEVIYRTRVQTIDPFSDARLCNDRSDPHYVMTGEQLGWLMNVAYQALYVDCCAEPKILHETWSDPDNAPLNSVVDASTLILLAHSCIQFKDSYLDRFFRTKGNRFSEQARTLKDVTDFKSKTNTRKAGPKDTTYLTHTAMMKAIAAFGHIPEYRFHDSETVITTIDELEAEASADKAEALNERALDGWLAVQYHEDPFADLSSQYAYEDLLEDYTLELSDCDEDNIAFNRYIDASDEAEQLFAGLRTSIRWTRIRSILQKTFSILLIFLPLVALAVYVFFCGLDNPTADLTNFKFKWVFYSLGLVAMGISFFSMDVDGCIVPILIGLGVSAVTWLLVKFLGVYIIWIYLAIIVSALVYFSIAVIFKFSTYASDARKVMHPGFEELTLEPLYYAYGDEESFDSSVNGFFGESGVEGWKDDIGKRRLPILIAFGVAVLLWGGSFLLPQSAQADRLLDKVENTIGIDRPDDAQVQEETPQTDEKLQ